MQDASLSSYYSHLISAVSAAAAAIGKCRNDDLDAQNILEQHISLVWKDGHSTATTGPGEASWSSLPQEPHLGIPPRAGPQPRRIPDGTPRGGVLVPAASHLGGQPRVADRSLQMTRGLHSGGGNNYPLILRDRGQSADSVALTIAPLFAASGNGQPTGNWTQRSAAVRSMCRVCGGQCGRHHPPMTSVCSVRRVLREVIDTHRSSAQSQSSETENTFHRQPTPISISDQSQHHRDATKTVEPHHRPLPSATGIVNSSSQPPAAASSSSFPSSSSFRSCSDSTIIVGYYYCDEPIPYRTTICGTSQPTLAQFKQLLTTKTATGKDGHFRYFFKKASNEFEGGVVREEVSDDQAVLPLWEGKIVCKIERSS